MSANTSSVSLDTSQQIDLAAVEAICLIPDDGYRLQWVSYAYYDLAKRLERRFGTNASWPSFARWSAFTIAEALRLDEVNPRLEEVLREHVMPARLTHALVEMQRRLRSLDNGAMPIVLALGNRMVFHEVGYTVAHFLDWLETQSKRDEDAWVAYEPEIRPFRANDFFRASYLTWLRDGMHAYYDAWWEENATTQAQLILKGNLLIGAYEQWRVDSFFEVALDFNPGSLVEDLRFSGHDPNQMAGQLVKVRHAGTRRALRHQWAMLNWAADAYAAFLTRFVMTWDAPLFGSQPTAVRLGCDVPTHLKPRRGGEHFALEDLGEAERLFAAFDRSAGELSVAGARNFRRFTDRMSFIANLFREQQQNPHLHVAPRLQDLRLLELQLTDAHLDGMRQLGDPLADEHFAASRAGKGPTPYNLLASEGVQVEYPEWVEPELIRRGQKFFKKHALEIASALFCASLPKAYTAARGSRVLLATAELVSDVSRRISETGRLLLDVMMPDEHGLEPGSRGHSSALAVRGFHASVRKLLADQEPWRSEWDEIPINQEDLLGTLTTFTVVVLEALEQMGVDVSTKDRDAYLHTWLVAGHILGVDYSLLRRRPLNRTLPPLTYFEMQLVRDVVFRRHAAPSPSGQILTRALLDLEESALPFVLRPLPPAAIRRFIGDDAADMIEVPPAGPARVLIEAIGPVGSAAGLFRRGVVIRPRLADMTTELFRGWLDDHETGPRAWSFDDTALKALNLRSRVVNLAEAERREHEAEPALWDDEFSSRD